MGKDHTSRKVSPREQVMKSLADPSHRFTRAEVALLMATGYRWGYEQRSDEEIAGLTPIEFSATELIRDLERKAAREESDRAARQQARADG